MPKPDIQQVSPVVAEQERAVSELNETMRNDEPHMPLKKSIKRRKKRAPTRRSLNIKGKRRLTRKKKQGRRRINSLRKNLKKKNFKSKKENHKQEENELQRNSHLLEKDHVLLKRVKHDDGRALGIGSLFRSTQSSSSA